MINNNNTLYLRKKISPTLIALSAIALLLLASSPLPLSNILLQPVQAQTTPMTFKTPKPAVDEDTTLTFDAQGTYSSSSKEWIITNGTFLLNTAGRLHNGVINSGTYSTTSGSYLNMYGQVKGNDLSYNIFTSCSSSDYNQIGVIFTSPGGGTGGFNPWGPVECTPTGGGEGNTPSSSSMTGTTTSQDSDGDGIPDSSDRCASNSNQMCYKESK